MRNDLVEFLVARSREAATWSPATGRPGKGNTLLNHAGIRSDLLAFTVDRNPFKHGKFLPGTHIPIFDVDEIAARQARLRRHPAVEPAGRDLGAARLRARVGRAPRRAAARRARGAAVKVVLFCGGLGLRIRSSDDSAPKPMVPIGDRPVLWHVMRYYAHFGHTEFILCLGYGARSVKEYFLDYQETHSNDFVLTKGGEHVELLGTDISEWRITFVDTGIDTAIGERLRRVRPYLDDDEVFLANYGDVLTDAPLDDVVDRLLATDAVGSLLAVPARGVVPRGGLGRGRPGHGLHAGRRPRPAHQRGLLRPAAGDLRLPARGRRPGHGRLHPRRGRRAACSPSPTTGSGRRWTRSRSGRCSRTCGAPASPLGRVARGCDRARRVASRCPGRSPPLDVPDLTGGV